MTRFIGCQLPTDVVEMLDNYSARNGVNRDAITAAALIQFLAQDQQYAIEGDVVVEVCK